MAPKNITAKASPISWKVIIFVSVARRWASIICRGGRGLGSKPPKYLTA
jgi:hypothetical protein